MTDTQARLHVLYPTESEEALVGSAIIDASNFALDVAPEDFHDAELGRIWGLGLDMVAADEWIDAFTVQAAISAHGVQADKDRPFALIALPGLDTTHAGQYANTVLEGARRRKIATVAQKLVVAANTSNGTLGDDVADLGAELARLGAEVPTPVKAGDWSKLTPGQLAHLAAQPAAGAPNRRPAIEPLADLSNCPALPAAAQLDPALSADASPWLAGYVEFSRRWAPRAYDGFHVGVGLWVLSTIANRRVTLDFGGRRYPSLYIANVARSSVWTKSTAHHIGAELLQACGLAYLLAPDEATPQALLARMSTPATVTDWDMKPVQLQEFDALALAFAGQKGWDYDEFGAKVAAMMRDSGAMADFRGILRRFDDAPERYDYATVGRGSNLIQRPFLALMASMTPADMGPHAKRGGALWHDGFWARFAFMAPGPDELPTLGRFPEGERIMPPGLLMPLRAWHDRLGTPAVDLAPRKDQEGKPTNQHDVSITAPAPEVCRLGRGVRDAFYAYHDALTMLAAASDNADLDGNYSRFAEKGMRVAMLLASLENDGVIELRHWALAQQVAERWRQSLHNLYRTLNAQQDAAGQLEDKIVELVGRLGAATPTDIHRYAPDVATTEAAGILERLQRAGALTLHGRTRKGTARYTVTES